MSIMNRALPNRALPWLVEERLDRSRILRRCSELAGGCGESAEIHLGKLAGLGKASDAAAPLSFSAWYRAHSRCGQQPVPTKRGRKQ